MLSPQSSALFFPPVHPCNSYSGLRRVGAAAPLFAARAARRQRMMRRRRRRSPTRRLMSCEVERPVSVVRPSDVAARVVAEELDGEAHRGVERGVGQEDLPVEALAPVQPEQEDEGRERRRTTRRVASGAGGAGASKPAEPLGPDGALCDGSRCCDRRGHARHRRGRARRSGRPTARSVGLPQQQPAAKQPCRPIDCASAMPGTKASAVFQKGSLQRRIRK